MEVIPIFEINRKKFGSFVAELRKEHGFTQKELANRLFISDKAVSKWETGISIPDTALLVPLADLLGVSVTELLMCEKMPRSSPLEPDKVENIVKTAIAYTDENPEKAHQAKTRRFALYLLLLLAGCAGTFLNYAAERPCLTTLATILLFCAVFGAYFCFAKTKLPAFYDKNAVNIFYDGPFRMNMPGIKFNNSNWTHILKSFRISACLSMAAFPILNFALGGAAPDAWAAAGNYILLALFLCLLFAPAYIAGRKYA